MEHDVATERASLIRYGSILDSGLVYFALPGGHQDTIALVRSAIPGYVGLTNFRTTEEYILGELGTTEVSNLGLTLINLRSSKALPRLGIREGLLIDTYSLAVDPKEVARELFGMDKDQLCHGLSKDVEQFLFAIMMGSLSRDARGTIVPLETLL